MKIGVIAKLTIQEGRNEAFEAAFLKFESSVNEQEDGNIFFRLLRSRDNPCDYTVMEQYSDQAALDIHQNADYYLAIPDTFGEFMAGPPDIEYLDGVS